MMYDKYRGILIAGSALVSETFAIAAAQEALGLTSDLQIINSAHDRDSNQANFKLVSQCTTHKDNSPITPGSCRSNSWYSHIGIASNPCQTLNQQQSTTCSDGSQVISDICSALLQSQSMKNSSRTNSNNKKIKNYCTALLLLYCGINILTVKGSFIGVKFCFRAADV
ncbi:MAG TPA: hypothetical protein VE619_08185 [Nitrososphaeraceae archaeon]|nr:hypothetical protein [Nitrososphaeraceae archaeon]